MSKSEPNTITTPGAAASRSRSTQKVLDFERRFIDASKATVGHGQYRNAVASGRTWCISTEEYRRPKTHPTLPRSGTDRIQVPLLTFEAKPGGLKPHKKVASD